MRVSEREKPNSVGGYRTKYQTWTPSFNEVEDQRQIYANDSGGTRIRRQNPNQADEELIGGKNKKGFLGQQTRHSTRPILWRNEGSDAQAEKSREAEKGA
jgi:hypothetical protein